MYVKNIYVSISFKLICICLYIIKINDFLVFSSVTIPFYYENKNQLNSVISISSPEEYFEQNLKLATYTNIKVNNKIIKFHLTLDRFTSYMSEKDFNKVQEDKENRDENLYSLDYIGISLANFQKCDFHFLINGTIEKKIENYTFFTVKKMKNDTEYNTKTHAYATEKNEIGLNIVKGNKYDTVDVGDYEPYLDPDFLLLKNKQSNLFYPKYLRKLDVKYIIKNGGYNVEEQTNMINQLKSNELISSYAFTIKFDKNNDLNGTIVIGGYPHEIDPKHYQEKYFIYDLIKVKYFYFYLHYTFKDITYGNEKLYWTKDAEFSFEFPFILSTWNYWKYLNQKFFNNEKYSKFCYEKKVGDYYTKYCSKEIIDKFQPFYFYLSKEYIKENQTDYIELNYKDLFIKSSFDDNKYLFQMSFVDNSYGWIFGKPLFKKYTTVIDQDRKLFGFYTESGEYNESNKPKDDEPESNNFKIWFYIIIIIACIFFIVAVILTIFFCKKFHFNKRKIKANELDDDYDYSSNKDKEQNPNGLLINE